MIGRDEFHALLNDIADGNKMDIFSRYKHLRAEFYLQAQRTCEFIFTSRTAPVTKITVCTLCCVSYDPDGKNVVWSIKTMDDSDYMIFGDETRIMADLTYYKMKR